MMRTLWILLYFALLPVVTKSQTLGGFTIVDYLVSAVHPSNCSPNYVTGMPDDSTWVNLFDGDIMTGLFGAPSRDTTGFELLLETSYHADNYDVRLLLSTNVYTAYHNVQQINWLQITDTTWVHLFQNCFVGMQGMQRYILPLDYNTHFGLSASDTVIGIEIKFLNTPGAPDLAGVYIIGGQPCNPISLGNDTTICQGSSLLLNANTPGATYLWQDNSTGSSYTVSQPGLYWVQVTLNNCVSTDTIQVNMSPVPTVHLGNDTSICPGSVFVLNATTPNATYQWQNNSTASMYTVNQAGLYWVEVTVNNCSATDTVLVNMPALSNTILGNDTSVCTGTTLLLNATTPNATYVWQDNSTASTYTVTQSGTYWVTLTLNNCSVTDTLHVNMSPKPSLNLGNDTTICSGASVWLDATTANATYIWQDNSTANVFLASQAGLYHVTVTVNNCSASDSIVLSNLAGPQVNLGNDTSICQGDTLQLDASFPNASYLWQDQSTGAQFAAHQSGAYHVTVMVNNCIDADTILINVQALPVLDWRQDTTLCRGSSLTLDATTPNATYQWQDQTTGALFTATQAGVYQVIVTVPPCSITRAISIAMEDCDLFIPNAFSPNQDGLNDAFNILMGSGYTLHEFRIYNRWGQEVFITQSAASGWNGQYLGKDCEVGTYFYYLIYSLPGTTEKNMIKGSVQLIR